MCCPGKKGRKQGQNGKSKGRMGGGKAEWKENRQAREAETSCPAQEEEFAPGRHDFT